MSSLEKRTLPAYTIFKKIAHHASHSGYDQLAKYVGTPLKVPNSIYRIRGLGNIHRFFRKRSGMGWYDGLYVEILTALHMRTHPASIYHVLYGENHFRYLPKLTSLRKHKVVCTFHATPDEFKTMMKSTEHLKTIDAAIVVSNIQKPLFDSILASDKVFFIPLGVDVEYFVPPHPGKKDSTKICLCVGHHHRDFSTLCKVAAILKNWDSEVRFIVINKVFSAYLTPEQQEFYKKSFAELGNVELRESVPDEELLRLYQTSDLMVLPLLDTTANIALLEALSCGLPLVTTDIGGVRDYVDPDIAAFVPPQNAEIMADQIMRLLQNPLGREKLSQASRKKAMSFDWRVVAEQVKQLYNQIAQY